MIGLVEYAMEFAAAVAVGMVVYGLVLGVGGLLMLGALKAIEYVGLPLLEGALHRMGLLRPTDWPPR